MANITRKAKTVLISFEPKDTRSGTSFKDLRRKVLNSFVREFSVVKNDNSVITISKPNLEQFSANIHVSVDLVFEFVQTFLVYLDYFKKFLSHCTIKYGTKGSERKLRIYLHKIYRLAPVFDYERATANLHTLQKLLFREYFWPSLTTQLALVVHITDKLYQKAEKKVLQKNIRAICNSSAYAFHMAKNRLNIYTLI